MGGTPVASLHSGGLVELEIGAVGVLRSSALRSTALPAPH